MSGKALRQRACVLEMRLRRGRLVERRVTRAEEATDGAIEAAFYAEFGRKLELTRKSQRMSQTEFAAEMGVHRNHVYRWECGDSAMELWELMRAADILRCDHRHLLPGQDYHWGPYLATRREGLPPKKGVQSERDPRPERGE